MYRPSTDLAPLLSEALWRLKNAESVQGIVSNPQSLNASGAESTDAQINTSLGHINQLILAQINTFLEQDSKAPFEHDQIDLEDVIKHINPQLWNAVCILTRSISELRGSSKVNDSSSPAWKKEDSASLCAMRNHVLH